MTNSKIIVGAGVAVVLFVALALGFSKDEPVPTYTPVEKPVAGERGGLQNFTDGVTPGDSTIVTKRISYNDGNGENVAFWRNNTSVRVFVGNPIIELRSTSTDSVLNASTTQKLFLATSSEATLNSYTDPFASILNGWEIATATAFGAGARATSTTLSQKVVHGFAQEWVPVEPGEYVVLIGQSGELGQDSLLGCGTTDLCSNASSSPFNGAKVNAYFDVRIPVF